VAVSLAATLEAAGLGAVEARGDVGLVRGAKPKAEILRLSVEAMRERMPDDIDIEAGLKVLDDPTSFEPGIIWYTAGVSGSSARRAEVPLSSPVFETASRITVEPRPGSGVARRAALDRRQAGTTPPRPFGARAAAAASAVSPLVTCGIVRATRCRDRTV
jgi:hypothetical protein